MAFGLFLPLACLLTQSLLWLTMAGYGFGPFPAFSLPVDPFSAVAHHGRLWLWAFSGFCNILCPIIIRYWQYFGNFLSISLHIVPISFSQYNFHSYFGICIVNVCHIVPKKPATTRLTYITIYRKNCTRFRIQFLIRPWQSAIILLYLSSQSGILMSESSFTVYILILTICRKTGFHAECSLCHAVSVAGVSDLHRIFLLHYIIITFVFICNFSKDKRYMPVEAFI